MATKTIKTVIQLRHDTTANWLAHKDFVPAAGEPCLDIDTGLVKYGNGVDTYENLPVSGGGSSDNMPSFEVADSIPAADNAQDGIFYLVQNADNGNYDIYAKAGTQVVKLGDTTIDLSGYVQKESGKRLMTNEEADKLANIKEGAQKNVIEKITIGGVEQTVTDKSVDIPGATAVALGLVKGSDAENGVTVNADFTMTVNSLNVNKLVQTDGDSLILNGGTAG